jgi:hypothetical protein
MNKKKDLVHVWRVPIVWVERQREQAPAIPQAAIGADPSGGSRADSGGTSVPPPLRR